MEKTLEIKLNRKCKEIQIRLQKVFGHYIFSGKVARSAQTYVDKFSVFLQKHAHFVCKKGPLL